MLVCAVVPVPIARAVAQQPDAGVGPEFGGWMAQVLPEFFVSLQFLDISLWQWIALTFLVVLASALGLVVTRFLVRLSRSLVSRSATQLDDALLDSVAGPLRLAVSLLVFYAATFALELSAQGQEAVAVLCKILAVAAAAWLAVRLIDVLAVYAERTFDARGQTGPKTLVPMGHRVTKVFVLIIALLSLLQNLGFNIAGLLAGLGIGGLAIALAAQKSLENLFGGFVVVADRPIKVGDFCKVGEHLGTVEDIGLRSSRLRTLDRTLVTIPNSEFSNVRIENYAVRDKMRLYSILQVGYDTSLDQLRYLLVEIRRMLYAHPRTLPDPCRVRFVNLGAYSLDIEVFAFIDTADWNEFLGIREDIFLRIMEIVERSGAYFAYPSQTLYLGRDGGKDMERTRAAEAAVEAWRKAGELPLPEFNEAARQAIDDTLEYPPPGSATRVQ